jgi:hypothetical protein
MAEELKLLAIQEQNKKERMKVYNEIREAVSCCCSFTRYEEINDLLDKLEEGEELGWNRDE